MGNRPYGPTGNRVWFSFFQGSIAGRLSGVEIAAVAGGSGVIIFRADIFAGLDLGFMQTDVAVIDVNRTVITPTIISDPGKPLTTVITQGQDSTGSAIALPDYFFRRDNEGDVLNGQELFIPPGKIMTFFNVVVANSITLSMAFTEL